MNELTYINFTKIKNAIKYHQEYEYTYFITITTNYKYHDTKPILKKFRDYAHHHDRNSHIISVKEITTIAKGVHYHILYFTNSQLDYKKVHKKMPKFGTIDIQLVKKTEEDIKRVLKYMNKNKKSHKLKSKLAPNEIAKKVSIFDFKV